MVLKRSEEAEKKVRENLNKLLAGKLPSKQISKEELKRKQEEAKKEAIERTEQEAEENLNRKNQVLRFISKQPFILDSAKIWWLWDSENFKWIRVDEIDILNIIEKSTGADVTTPQERNKILNEIKQQGRKNKDKIQEVKPTWIQFKNKIVDIETGETFEASPEFFITNPVPWKLGDSEDTPTLDKLFKDWVVTENLQDKSYIKTLQEIMAYCLSPTSFLQRIIALVGGGANGKSTFQQVIEKFIGVENITSTELDLLQNRFETANLYKMLVVFVGEVDKSLFKKTGIIKRLSGEDLIRIEFKGKDGFKTRLYCKPIISCNKLPESTDSSLGFFRRWLVIDFFNRFPKQKDIINTIPDWEFENFARKSIRILQELYRNGGFTNEGSFEEREKKYKAHSNPLDSFIQQNCQYEANSFIVFQEFFEAYQEWILSNEFKKQTKRDLGVSIRNNKRIDKKLHTYNKADGTTTTETIVKGLKWKEET